MSLENYDWGQSPTTLNTTNSTRTPLTLISKIKDVILGKVFCDLGCGEGDLALCSKQYATKVICVECDSDRAEIARMKGLDVVKGNLLDIQLPNADVYYMYIGSNCNKVYEKIDAGKMVIIIPQFDQREWLEHLGAEKFTMNYIRESIQMTLVWYVITKY